MFIRIIILLSGIFEFLSGCYMSFSKKGDVLVKLVELAYLYPDKNEKITNEELKNVIGSQFAFNGSIYIFIAAFSTYFQLNFIISLIVFIMAEWLSGKRIVKAIKSLSDG